MTHTRRDLLIQHTIAFPVHLIEDLLVVRDLRFLLRLCVGNLRAHTKKYVQQSQVHVSQTIESFVH